MFQLDKCHEDVDFAADGLIIDLMGDWNGGETAVIVVAALTLLAGLLVWGLYGEKR